MKLSVIDKLKKGFQELRITSSVLAKGFPRIMDSDYEPVWEAFLETKTSKDISKIYSGELCVYVTAMAFISHMLAVDKHSVGNAKVDLLKNSSSLLDLQSPSTAMYNFVQKSRLMSSLRQYSHTVDIDQVSYNNFIRASVGFTLTGSIVLKPTARHTLDGILHDELKGTLFKSVPQELSSHRLGLPRKFLDASQVHTSKSSWYTLLIADNLKLDIARARYSTLVLRYTIVLSDVVFGPPRATQNAVLSAWHKTRKL